MIGQLCISLHDVAPATWPACQRVLSALREISNTPLSLLVVPHYRGCDSANDSAFVAAMEKHLAKGDELVLHGFTHVDSGEPNNFFDRLRRRIYTAGEGEFSALPEDQALSKLQLGCDWFAARGWPLHGFIAPAWLMSIGTRRALRRMPLSYTSTWGDLISLPDDIKFTAPSLCYSTRAAWRRQASVLWSKVFVRANTGLSLVRLALHPHDADYPVVKHTWQNALRRLLVDRDVVLESNWVEKMRAARNNADTRRATSLSRQ